MRERAEREKLIVTAALVAVSKAYTSFADRHPALYDAMFSQAVALPFATPEAPAPLHAGFDELAEALRPHVDAHDLRLTFLLNRFTSPLGG